MLEQQKRSFNIALGPVGPCHDVHLPVSVVVPDLKDGGNLWLTSTTKIT